MHSRNADWAVEGEGSLFLEPMCETSLLHCTPGEINNLLGAQKRSINNVNITIDRAEVSIIGRLLLLSRCPYSFPHMFCV